MNLTVKLLTLGGRGEARLFLERDQTKSKALEISSEKFSRQSSTRKIDLEFSTRANPLVVPKMVDFAPQRNARYTSGFPFYTLLSFFYPYLKSVYGRSAFDRTLTSYPNFLGSIGFPNFLYLRGFVARA